MSTALYRLYDMQGRLLYVGIANAPHKRFVQHAGKKAWWNEVGLIEIDRFPSREEAEEAERQAIRAELPFANIQSMPKVGPLARAAALDDRCRLVLGTISELQEDPPDGYCPNQHWYHERFRDEAKAAFSDLRWDGERLEDMPAIDAWLSTLWPELGAFLFSSLPPCDDPCLSCGPVDYDAPRSPVEPDPDEWFEWAREETEAEHRRTELLAELTTDRPAS